MNLKLSYQAIINTPYGIRLGHTVSVPIDKITDIRIPWGEGARWCVTVKGGDSYGPIYGWAEGQIHLPGIGLPAEAARKMIEQKSKSPFDGMIEYRSHYYLVEDGSYEVRWSDDSSSYTRGSGGEAEAKEHIDNYIYVKERLAAQSGQ